HLELCAACSSELDALRLQTETLRQLPDLEPPAHLAARLRAVMALEGLRLSSRHRMRSSLRIAASVALFAAGGLTGYLGRGAVAAEGAAAADRSPPTTLTEAAQRVEEAEARYTDALAAYARLGGSIPAADPVSRLAALEGIVLMTGAALDEAPADPVINGYHLTALEQRDAILRQLERRPAQESDDE